MSRTEAAFVAATILLVAGLVLWGMTIGHYPAEANIFPALAAGALALFGIAVLVRPDLSQRGEPVSWQAALWLAVLLPVIYLLGFRIGLPVYALAFAWAKRAGVPSAVLLAILVGLFIEIMFVRILGTPLDPGWLIERLG